MKIPTYPSKWYLEILSSNYFHNSVIKIGYFWDQLFLHDTASLSSFLLPQNICLTQPSVWISVVWIYLLFMPSVGFFFVSVPDVNTLHCSVDFSKPNYFYHLRAFLFQSRLCICKRSWVLELQRQHTGSRLLRLIFLNYMGAHNIQDSSSMGLDALFWPLQTPGTYEVQDICKQNIRR